MHQPDFNQHGFLRVAAATPVVSIADPAANAEAILKQLQDLAGQQVAVAVFPELGLSSYSAEDLFFPRTYSLIVVRHWPYSRNTRHYRFVQ